MRTEWMPGTQPVGWPQAHSKHREVCLVQGTDHHMDGLQKHFFFINLTLSCTIVCAPIPYSPTRALLFWKFRQVVSIQKPALLPSVFGGDDE